MRPNVFSSHRRKIPAKRDHYGIFMTLCIAAIARREKKIITATDFLLSTEIDSADTPAMKVIRTGCNKRWLTMFAGDPSIFIDINTDVLARLSGTEERAMDMAAAFEGAYKDRLKRKIEDETLSIYGLTRKEFLDQGRESFGKEEFLTILHQMADTKLETDFLVAGFDGPEPCILSISDPGVAYTHDLSSFSAIGCGAPLAEATLTATFDPFATTTDVIYRVSEAKFVGERAPGVGRSTLITVFGLNEEWKGIFPTAMKPIKDLWLQKGVPPVPVEAAGLITSGFKPLA
jgi:hypothetical protein